MRIAIVATSYPRDPDDAAGHFVRAEALALARAGHEVHVVAPRPASDAELVVHAASGDELFRWPGAAARLREDPRRVVAATTFVTAATRALRRLDADEVVAHWAVPCAAPIALLAKPRSLAIVCHGADVRLLLALPMQARTRVIAAMLRREPRVRFVATVLRDALAAALPRALAIDLLARSIVEPALVDVSCAAPAYAHPRPYAAFVGRLVPSKRAELALAATRNTNLDLLVVGDGPERARLARSAPDRSLFLGLLPRREALGVLRGAMCLLHPSAIEAAPTTVLEARALGVPVLATDAGDVGLWSRRDAGITIVREGAWPGALATCTDHLRT